jgi:hypothetical protein
MIQFLFKWIFLVSIELIHNPEHVQIVGPSKVRATSGAT